jgi:hypothetical protein
MGSNPIVISNFLLFGIINCLEDFFFLLCLLVCLLDEPFGKWTYQTEPGLNRRLPDSGHKTNPAVSPRALSFKELPRFAHINHADNFSALFDLTCFLWVL